MKHTKLLPFIFIVFLVLQNIFSNPIMIHHLNELKFTGNEWELELGELEYLGENLNGYYLTTLTDTSYFKDGIETYDKEFLIITNNSLTKPLFINTSGDVLTLYFPDGFAGDELGFGEVDYTRISAPKEGQSMSLNEYYQGDYEDFFYLDNSPTLGFVNDWIDAEGTIDGYVTDVLSNPLEGVEVIYDYNTDGIGGTWPVFVSTNSDGYFILTDVARIANLEFKKEDYITQNTSQQIWPDSTVTLYIIMQEDPNSIDNENPLSPDKYILNTNFPNPFNNSTKITYELPIGDYIEISIFDMNGRFIEKLYAGFQPAGKYSVIWDEGFLSSGVYIYQMETSTVCVSKKCLLIK